MDTCLALEAHQQAAMIRGGKLSAEDLMRATLARIDAVNGTVNAIVSLRDQADLMAEARAVDAGPRSGALSGIPMAVKDLEDVRGLPTSQGSPVFAGQIAQDDCLYVARLRAAGVIFIGKTNTPEFGLGSQTYNPVHGVTRNPYDLRRTCGGSSGGAAVAVATGMLGLADGSDMMGSLRNPAGWNNVYGMRPSFGLIPNQPGGDVFLHQISVNGPMARCPQDLALLLSVMAGPDPRVPGCMAVPDLADLTPRSGARVAWLGDWGGALPYEDGILPLSRDALQVFAQDGGQVDDLDAPFDAVALWRSWCTLRSFSQAASRAALLDNPKTRAQLKPEAIWEAEQGAALTARDIQCASEVRSHWYAQAATLFDTYDALALPTAQVWPFDHGQSYPRQIGGTQMDTYHRWMEGMIPASLIGLPTVAVPAGFGPSGLPMGVQLIGRHGSDAQLLALAEGYHRATRWPQKHPPQV